MISKIRSAILDRRLIRMAYEGNLRVVEPYMIGINTQDNIVLLAYQVSGCTSSENLPSWRNFIIEKIESVEILEAQFDIVDSYKPCGRNMRTILLRIEKPELAKV